MQGHLEGYVSGTAVRLRYKKEPSGITDPVVWDELAKWLAVGLNNTIVHWSPDVVVLGGSMITGEPAIPMDAIERHLGETMRIFPTPPSLKKGELGDLGGLYGALELATQYV
jgi:predicted NBD/HSP70 family sugar kinase